MNMSLVKKTFCVAALTVAICTPSAWAGGKGIAVGDTFPDLGSFGLEGKLPGDLKGRVVLVDFWASWCGPCKDSFPAMDELQKKYGAQGLVVLAVSVDQDAEAMKDFLKEHPASFPIVHDAKKKLVSRVNISSMPASIVIGRDGKVVAIHKGFHGKETVSQYHHEFDGLLGVTVASK